MHSQKFCFLTCCNFFTLAEKALISKQSACLFFSSHCNFPPNQITWGGCSYNSNFPHKRVRRFNSNDDDFRNGIQRFPILSQSAWRIRGRRKKKLREWNSVFPPSLLFLLSLTTLDKSMEIATFEKLALEALCYNLHPI